MTKGTKHSEQTKLKMKKLRPSMKGNRNGFIKGKSPWNKGLKGYLAGKIPWNKGKKCPELGIAHLGNKYCLGRKHSKLTKEKLSKAATGRKGYWKGKKRPEISEMLKKRIITKKTREKMSKAHIGSKSQNWKGGISYDKKYMNWLKGKRNRVLKRINSGGSIHTFIEWETLKKKYNNICLCCKKSESEIKLTEDHIIPLSKGGTDEIENIQPLCQRCNSIKNTKVINYAIAL